MFQQLYQSEVTYPTEKGDTTGIRRDIYLQKHHKSEVTHPPEGKVESVTSKNDEKIKSLHQHVIKTFSLAGLKKRRKKNKKETTQKNKIGNECK